MAYSSQLKDKFNEALKAEEVKKIDASANDVGVGLVGAPACGDVMKMLIQFDANGVIVESSVKTFGCGAAIASARLASEMIKNKTIEEARKIKNEDIAKALELPPVKRHCSLLAEQAIRAAIENFEKKNLEAK